MSELVRITEYDRCECCGTFCSIYGWTNWIGWCANPDSPRYRTVLARDELPCAVFSRRISTLQLVKNKVSPRQAAMQQIE